MEESKNAHEELVVQQQTEHSSENKPKEDSGSVLDVSKNGMGSYTFLAASGARNDGSYFCNDFVGFPSVPMLGQYGKMGYEINEIKMLSVHECDCTSGKILASATSEEIVLPEKLKQLILNVPEDILSNKPILYDDDVYSRNPGLQENIEYEPLLHDYPFPKTSAFNFGWSVSFLDQNVRRNLRPMPMNIVLHSFVYPVIDLYGKKRICCDVPVCVFPAELEPGMKPWKKDFRSVSFEEFRSEFLSVHMRGDSLCFSPNNLKFEMNPEVDISHFYSFVLTEDGFYMVSYHWNVNNPRLFQPLDKIFEISKDTREIIHNLTKLLGDKSPCVQTLNHIFQNAKNPPKQEEDRKTTTVDSSNPTEEKSAKQEENGNQTGDVAE